MPSTPAFKGYKVDVNFNVLPIGIVRLVLGEIEIAVGAAFIILASNNTSAFFKFIVASSISDCVAELFYNTT